MSSTQMDPSVVNNASDSYIPGAYPESLVAPPVLSTQQSLSRVVYDRRAEYTRPRKIRIKIGTWNVGNQNCARDIGGWFVEGKGIEPDLAGIESTPQKSSSIHEEREGVKDQESRYSKKSPTIPKGDSAAVPAADRIGLYVLGLQEIVDISSPAEALRPYTDPTTAKKYKDAVQDALPPDYKLVGELQLIGMLLLLYASPEFFYDITSVSMTSVGTGLMGYMGNKGAVTARIVLGEFTKLVFVNCHLAAGSDKAALERRNWDSGQITSRTRFDVLEDPVEQTSTTPDSIGNEDFAFWFGDLNYRLDSIPGDDVRRLLMLHTRNEHDLKLPTPEEKTQDQSKTTSKMYEFDSDAKEVQSIDSLSLSSGTIRENDGASDHELDKIPDHVDPASLQTTLASLLPHDELSLQIKARKAFHQGWKEGPIRFLPTYKYDLGTVGVFDSSDKKRGPSWCDRILYRTKADHDAYERHVRAEEEARKRDEELKSRGIEDASNDESLLFDYDPEEDGDDSNYHSENPTDTDATKEDDTVDEIALEYYTSHQRVLSSDHKPLEGIFILTYASVVPDLKSKVHNEVARELDRAENEGRPSVTIVVDRRSGEFDSSLDLGTRPSDGVVDFGNIHFGKGKHTHITIANTGQVPAVLSFVDRPSSDARQEVPLPEWLIARFDRDPDPKDPKERKKKGNEPPTYTLEPGDTCNVELIARVETMELSNSIEDGTTVLDDVLILRVQDGRDHFLPVQGRWIASVLSRSIEKLRSIPEDGIRKLQHQKLTGSGSSTPVDSRSR